ncbi:hypothetical protein PR202_gb20333 [Eleusine coracana subsp. coracana]|uniref:glutathione transferase n=1 Tax=Eleusine coracana subsp. coracana TaxID=191504 RepID=A0AAV5FAH0_ELECO|nr:hypothetical protein PR202_gb20333 [Eleusine coracana subsp. coracana]
MKVYGPALSTNVARILVCMEEPFGQVPAFKDGDLTLFESRAISKYVLRKGGSELLRESNLSQSAMVDVWIEVEAQIFDTAMSAITFECLTKPTFMGGTTNYKIVEENVAWITDIMERPSVKKVTKLMKIPSPKR